MLLPAPGVDFLVGQPEGNKGSRVGLQPGKEDISRRLDDPCCVSMKRPESAGFLAIETHRLRLSPTLREPRKNHLDVFHRVRITCKIS
jgi:hypothetical protein